MNRPATIRPGTDCARLYDALLTGPKTAAELYGLSMIVHSRISDLRSHGCRIQLTRIPGKRGAASYRYELLPALSERDTVSTRTVEATDGAPPVHVPLAERPEQLALEVPARATRPAWS